MQFNCCHSLSSHLTAPPPPPSSTKLTVNIRACLLSVLFVRAALEKLPATEVMPLPAHVQARIHANIQQHTARREVVIEQQRKNLCWWEQ
jgi:hypothetical protein